MSDDNNNSDPFDFDFDALNGENPPIRDEEPFDLDNPFGDDIVVSRGGVSADNPYLGDSIAADLPVESEQNERTEHPDESDTKGDDKIKRKGFWGGKGKSGKEKVGKVAKEKKPLGELVPQDLGAALCVAFTVLLLISLAVCNIAAFLTRGSSILQTLCFLGAFNIVGLVLLAVPILFYKFPNERTLPNVLLGISVVALFSGVLVLVSEFYSYSFILKP